MTSSKKHTKQSSSNQPQELSLNLSDQAPVLSTESVFEFKEAVINAENKVPFVAPPPPKDFVDKVLEFNQVAGATGKFDTRKLALYIGLILEETAEMIEAIGDQGLPELGKLHQTLNNNSKLFKEGAFDNQVKYIDRVKALDAGVDIAVVALGAACSVGADVQGACHNVADSNLSKTVEVDGVRQFVKDANGKVTKPPTYTPPDLVRYLA